MSDEPSVPEGELARRAARVHIQSYLKKGQGKIEEFLCIESLFPSQVKLLEFVEELWDEEVEAILAAIDEPGVDKVAGLVDQVRSCLEDYFLDNDEYEESLNPKDVPQWHLANQSRKANAYDLLKKKVLFLEEENGKLRALVSDA